MTTPEDDGWAGFAAPNDGLALLVPLTAAIREAGAPLAERARARAMERYGDLGVAPDILGGNALLALEGGMDRAHGAVAACLGGIAQATHSRCFVMTAVRKGEAIDCALTRLDRNAAPARFQMTVVERLANLLDIPARRIVPGVLVRRE